MPRTISKLLNKIKGVKRNQKFFERLFGFFLSGMNYNISGDFENNGEKNVLKYIKSKTTAEGAVIFDVGANIGKYSILLSEIFGSRATIHSFEPSKKTFEIFKETTKNATNITANNFGMSDSENEETLYTNCDGSGIASLYKRNLDHFGIEMNKNEKIKLSTIYNYCQNNRIEKIDFLKMDIEGHELSALKGAKKMLSAGKIDFIQFEFGGCNIDSRTYFQDFFYALKDNFHIYRILKDGLEEIPRYDEKLEIFITTNYLAERK